MLPGIDAQFYCGGTGEILVWEVDGLPLNIAEIKERGITAVTVTSSGTVQSNLTVPATSVNNGTTVRCAISVSLTSMSVISNFSTLIVLPGNYIYMCMYTAYVLNVRLNKITMQL